MRTEPHNATEAKETNRLGCRLTLEAGHGLASRLADWGATKTRGYVCVANTHQVAQAHSEPGLNQALANAQAVTTDSQVLASALAILGLPYPEPVLYGPDLMQAVIASAASAGLSIGLFGSTPQVCSAVRARIHLEHPNLIVSVAICPPVKTLEELASGPEIAELAQAAPDILLVSLGCPKQEQWMFLTNRQIPGMKIGLGGAFEFYAGVRKRSPAWVHKAGLEWLYRLCWEPRRLLHRYLVNNPIFVWLWLRAMLRSS